MNNNVTAIFVILLSLSAPSNAQDADEIRKAVLTPYADIIPAYETVISDKHYMIAVDDYRERLYISCRDSDFRIEDKSVIGLPLSSFGNRDEIKLMPGWGHYLALDEHWYAGFGFKELNDDSKASWVFQYDMRRDRKKIDLRKKERSQNRYQRLMVSIPRENDYLISYTAKIDGIRYDIAVDEILSSLYIQTNDPDFELNGKAIIGQPLSSVGNIENVKYLANWGSYLALDERWYAMLGKKYGVDDDAKILFVFQYEIDRATEHKKAAGAR